MLLARARNLAVLAVGVSLAVSLAAGPVHAAAIASDGRVQAGPVRSPGMAVVGGTVTGAGGAVMGGVRVDLYAWPSDAVLQGLRPGQMVPTTLLATAASSKAGRFMLRVPAVKVKAAAVESGYANLEIFSAAGGIWFMSYPTSSLPARPSAPATVNLSPDLGVNCGKDTLGRPYAFSGFFKLKQLNPAWAIVGQGYVNPNRKTRGDSMQFDYNKAASHSQTSGLGLGVSGYGISAGYNGSGTNTSTGHSEQDYSAQTQNTWFRTRFNVALFRGECHGLPGDNSVPQEKQHGFCPRKYVPIPSLVYYTRKCFWLVRSTGWFGAASVVHPRPIPNTPPEFCGEEPKGQVVKTANEEAVQWSSGFEIGTSNGIKGVKLTASFNSSSQTGYDVNAQMRFTFVHAGFICGTNKQPSEAAILVMRSNRS